LTLPEWNVVTADDRYKDMVLDTRTGVGLNTSVACSDYSSSGSGTVIGIDSFFKSFKSMGTEVPGKSCASNDLSLTCTDPPSSDVGKACKAAVDFLGQIKNTIRIQSTFRCDVFANPSGSGPCDVKDMYKDAQGVWRNTCRGADGRVKVLHIYCNLEEYEQYIKEWDQRLENVLANIDDDVIASMTKVNTDMRDLVTGNVLRPVNAIVDAFDCSFMYPLYQDLVYGMCYQGMRGFSNMAYAYYACAMLMILLAFFMYRIWRRAHDNWETWIDPLSLMEDFEEDAAFLDDIDKPEEAALPDRPSASSSGALPPAESSMPAIEDTAPSTYGARSDPDDADDGERPFNSV